jgi:Arc/MetJ-type ribon-helix-helix transcriptional regulator
MPKGYRTVSLPEPLLERIEEYLSTHPEYTSLADFVKEAVREKLDSLDKK